MYTLEGKEGKYAVSLTMSSSGELLRLVKSVETSKKKASKAG